MLPALALAALAAQDVHCSETRIHPPGVRFSLYTPNRSMDLTGRWAVIPSGGTMDYALHTYEQDVATGEWQFRETLAEPAGGSWFGYDYQLEVELDGATTLMVGEPKWRNAGGVERGALHVFEWDPGAGSWLERQLLLPPIPGFVRFGNHFARDGEWLAVGSEGVGKAIYMHRRDPATGDWTYDSTIAPIGGGFTTSTALRGDLLLTLATGPTNSYAYRRSAADEWVLEGLFPFKLLRPRILAEEVHVWKQASVGGYVSGSVQVLRQDASTGDWFLAQTLDEDDFPPFQKVNPGVFMRWDASEEMLVSSGPGHDAPGGEEDAGRAFVYVRDPATGDWTPDGILERATPAEDERFGTEVALDGTRVLLRSYAYYDELEAAWSFDLDPTDCDGDGVPDVCELTDPLQDRNADGILDVCQIVGTVYCTPANTNSTGASARLGGLGSPVLADATLELCADRMPPDEFGYLLASSAPDFIPNVGGSSGNLCIAGGPDFGRYTDQILSSGPFGLACTTVHLPLVPTAKGPHVLLPGETWYFQFWYRDGTTSNHTDGVEVFFE